ncbi:MAG TPA: CoA transferase, partial [Burkholderiales bacterium]|nr:CoA transferase [Burkholderiales bacterium]
TAGRLRLTGKYPCYHVYRTQDGRWITLAALETKFWSEFCRAVDRPDLLDFQYSEDPKVLAEVAAVFAGRTSDEWAALAKQTDFCAEPVHTVEEALLDIQVRRRGLVRLTRVGEESSVELGNPLRRLDGGEPGSCPEHGEHTRELLGEVGYTGADLAELEASGVIPGRRP